MKQSNSENLKISELLTEETKIAIVRKEQLEAERKVLSSKEWTVENCNELFDLMEYNSSDKED